MRYDLMRIDYDPDSGDWGELEAMLLSEETGMSITEPRVSPDGKWVLFCMSDYGCFPVYQSSSDLYLLNLETREYHPLAVNSPRSESWHCWSANSRWIAFASKRRDGVFGRIGVDDRPVDDPLVFGMRQRAVADLVASTVIRVALAPQRGVQLVLGLVAARNGK